MADSIKIGNLDISAFKVGSADTKVYLGDTLLYPQSPTPPTPTPTYEWKQYNEGDTVPSKLFYGVKLGDPNMEEAGIEFGDTINTDIIFYFDINYQYGWYAIDNSGKQIDISEYFDETEGCFIIYFSDFGLGAMPIFYPVPSDMFEFDVQLYEEVPQWVTFSDGDTIPSDLQIYGIRGKAANIADTFVSYNEDIIAQLNRNKVDFYFGERSGPTCYSEQVLATDNVEYIFSNISCSDYFNMSTSVSVSFSAFQLYIYA